MTEPEKILTTVMFADVCRSTYLYSSLGDEVAKRLVETALASAAETVANHGGTVLRSKGDDILCIFERADDALAAALAIHRGVAELSTALPAAIDMRIGINTGQVLLSSREIAGDTVNISARICDLAKGGQTLVSSSCVDHIESRPPGLLRGLGDVVLKGKTRPAALFEVLDEEQQDEITQVAPAAGQAPTSNRLILVFQGKEHRLDFRLARFLLGRSHECDLVVEHPLVSRQHAEIRYLGNGFVLTDFSTNGTLLVRRGRRHPVNHGQVALRGRGSLFLGRTLYNRELEIAYHASGGAHPIS